MLDEFHLQRLNGTLAPESLADLLDRDLSKFNPLALTLDSIQRSNVRYGR